MKKTFVIQVEYPDCDYVPSEELVEVTKESFDYLLSRSFGANIMDGDYDRIKVKEVTDFLPLVAKMRDARHKYSSLSREYCSKGMKPRQSQEWQDARKLTKQLESEVDEYLKKMEEEK